jgi:hypothetical protein
MNDYLQEYYYEFEKIKPQVLTHLSILIATLQVAFQTQHFPGVNGSEVAVSEK